MRMLFHVVACFHPTHAAILIGHKAWPSWWPLHILLQLFHNYLVMTMIVINTLSRILVFWCGISLVVVVIIKLESKYALAQIEHFNEGWCTFCPVWIKARRVSSTLMLLSLFFCLSIQCDSSHSNSEIKSDMHSRASKCDIFSIWC